MADEVVAPPSTCLPQEDHGENDQNKPPSSDDIKTIDENQDMPNVENNPGGETKESIVKLASLNEPVQPTAEQTEKDSAVENTEDETSEPMEEQSTEPIEDQLTKPIEDQPTKPIEDQPTKPIEDQSTEPIKGQSTEPIEDDSTENHAQLKEDSENVEKSEDSIAIGTDGMISNEQNSSEPMDSMNDVKDETLKSRVASTNSPMEVDEEETAKSDEVNDASNDASNSSVPAKTTNDSNKADDNEKPMFTISSIQTVQISSKNPEAIDTTEEGESVSKDSVSEDADSRVSTKALSTTSDVASVKAEPLVNGPESDKNNDDKTIGDSGNDGTSSSMSVKSVDNVKVKSEPGETSEKKVDVSSRDGPGLKITAVSSIASSETNVNGEVDCLADKGKKSTGQDLKSYAADMMDEFLGIMGMDKLDDNEKQDIGDKIDTKTAAEEAKEKARTPTPPASNSTETKPTEKKPEEKKKKKSHHKCIVCGTVGKCKYNIVRNGDVKHLCNDVCFKTFRASPSRFLQNKSDVTPEPVDPLEHLSSQNSVKSPPSLDQTSSGRKCTGCAIIFTNTKNVLIWQTLGFCGEGCLGKFQKNSIKPLCGSCCGMIAKTAKLQYCARFDNEIRQFCTNKCQEEFLLLMKSCAFCKKNTSQSPDAFMAPVNGGTTFHDFCSPECHTGFEQRAMSLQPSLDSTPAGEKDKKKEEGADAKPRRTRSASGLSTCAVCMKMNPIKHELTLENKVHRICSDPCFAAFRYAKKMDSNLCDNCNTPTDSTAQRIQFEGVQKKFCNLSCMQGFKTQRKKTVPCTWCAAKKTNFDMIERADGNGKYQLFCTLNCMSLFRVNIQASSNKNVKCDQCCKFIPAQYHLTMSDATVRNFCSYQCVMGFQAQFKSKPVGVNNQEQKKIQVPQTVRGSQIQVQNRMPIPGPPKYTIHSTGIQTMQPNPRHVTPIMKTVSTGQVQTTGSFPVIANVMSLAPQVEKLKSQQMKIPTPQPQIMRTETKIVKEVVIQQPAAPLLRNKATLSKPFCQTKATTCRPHCIPKSTQTDENMGKPIFLPIPVPIYVPVPVASYSMPTPIMIPVPIPIPVPCFIPTGGGSADQILKDIKEIRERIPTDPFEAELLMMAEAVADGDESEVDTPVKAITNDSSTHNGQYQGQGQGPGQGRPQQPAPANTSVMRTANSGDVTMATSDSNAPMTDGDVLEMALKMAAEMTEPALDLETSLDNMKAKAEMPEVDNRRGTKRQTRSRGRGRSKRQRLDEEPEDAPTPPPRPQTPALDADCLLKFTYGVNAWKHWVRQKNLQLERASKLNPRIKLFKTDLLECSADELNYSLCLFVKEVRKPNGEEYAADSIQYLCLGIQHYLYTNSRADNIFTDIYYEKFTECLNDVMTRFEPRISATGQLLCRIEEDHLWECKQLGAHSPHVLLNTLIYFNTRFFRLKTSDHHLKLAFSHVMKAWKRNPGGQRSVYLRYFAPSKDSSSKKPRENSSEQAYEQMENTDNPLRCPVKLFEFYVSKCPESIKNRSDLFYLVPERSCVPDSPVWYSTQPLGSEAMTKMLNRVKLVKEVQEADYNEENETES